MSKELRILVCTDRPADANVVAGMLREEFDRVFVAGTEAGVLADFERHRPSVLVLAFDRLARAERYYRALHRQRAKTRPHRTLILCGRDEVEQAYELCRDEFFDDYVLYWPMVHDAHRLGMSVMLARRALDNGDRSPAVAAVAASGEAVDRLETWLDQGIAAGSARIEAVEAAFRRTAAELGQVIARFSDSLLRTGLNGAVEIHDSASTQQALTRLDAERAAPLAAAASAARPLREWVAELKREAGEHLAPLQALRSVAERLRPLVLVVDDDELQCKLLATVLASDRYALAFAHTAAEALAAASRRRPDLILMDVMLPDLDGVEATRRLKAMPEHADVPVVMITGHSERDVVSSSLAAGAIDFVVKPFQRDVLLRKVEKYLPS